jgi:uncharacterized protein (DUF2126 family)
VLGEAEAGVAAIDLVLGRAVYIRETWMRPNVAVLTAMVAMLTLLPRGRCRPRHDGSESAGRDTTDGGHDMSDIGDFERALVAHDAALAAMGAEIWVGNEPTFTNRHSHATEWVSGALGEEKLRLAEAVLAALACSADLEGCAVLRCIGRQYPGETLPRWSLGMYALRDGTPVWSGPRDPLLARASGREGDSTTAHPDLATLGAEIDAALERRGFLRRARASPGEVRIAFAASGRALPFPDDPRLLRPSIHASAISAAGLLDELADEGVFLIVLAVVDDHGGEVPSVELPSVADVDLFCTLLAAVAEAARACAAPALVLRGFPPPVDARTSWTTVTPDPAVVEVNMAPHASARAFWEDNRRCFAAAASTGLDPYRLYYNGTVADSGGGGQITLGGPAPLESPFFRCPQLLPRLIAYFQRHPSLSYLFAHDSAGPSSQSVRADEQSTDSFVELRLSLSLLASAGEPSPSTLWQSLAPVLADPTGNSHRAEINIEKLWNPSLPGRGQLGLVEFRAFRMQHTPERAAALAALLRTIVAMLMTRESPSELIEWGQELHDRFALPLHLEADFHLVLADLDDAGLALPPPIAAELASDPWRTWAIVELAGGRLTIRRALEFWSLLGDASHQQGPSRLVDASTQRIELALRGEGLDGFCLRAEDVELPLRAEVDEAGPVRVVGLRYRSFVPSPGLHPTLAAQMPLRLVLTHPIEPEALEITLHEWRPDKAPYDGLPRDLTDSEARRAERCVCRRLSIHEIAPALDPPPEALRSCSLDLRYLPLLARRGRSSRAGGR